MKMGETATAAEVGGIILLCIFVIEAVIAFLLWRKRRQKRIDELSNSVALYNGDKFRNGLWKQSDYDNLTNKDSALTNDNVAIINSDKQSFTNRVTGKQYVYNEAGIKQYITDKRSDYIAKYDELKRLAPNDGQLTVGGANSFYNVIKNN